MLVEPIVEPSTLGDQPIRFGGGRPLRSRRTRRTGCGITRRGGRRRLRRSGRVDSPQWEWYPFQRMDQVTVIYILTTVAVLLLVGWVKYSDWKAVHKHHHR